jgi:hypothetical protein
VHNDVADVVRVGKPEQIEHTPSVNAARTMATRSDCNAYDDVAMWSAVRRALLTARSRCRCRWASFARPSDDAATQRRCCPPTP